VRHNRPQLPVPNALLDHVKGKFQNSGTHEIKKVAEARMRKRKRAMSKLKAAKAQAKTCAENPDMSDKQKIRVRCTMASSPLTSPLHLRRSKKQ
jgi:AdoMet-dependent rRNA methyltransferase SPB1